MLNKQELTFASEHFDDNAILALISQTITSDSPEFFIINQENGFPFKLDTTHLNNIRRQYPHKPDVYTTKPVYVNKLTNIGRWQSVGVKDLLIRKSELLILQRNASGTKDVSALEAKMALTAAWYKNDFAAILAAYNTQLDVQGFRDLIFFAVEFEGLIPLPQTFQADSEPKERNYVFPAGALLDLAQRKKLNIGGLCITTGDEPKEKPKIQFQTKPQRPSAEERKKRYQKEADRIQNEYPQANKGAIAEAIINHLLEHDRAYITKEDGEAYPISTITRLIRLKKVSTV